MNNDFINATIAGVFSFTVAFVLPTTPVIANEMLKKLSIGVGAAILLNEVTKGQVNNTKKKAKQNVGGVSQDAQAQQFLNELGYDAGPVDGKPGQQTRAAIENFQRDRGYPITGDLTATQFAALQANRQMVVSPPASGTISRASTFEAQVYLNQLGFNAGTPDGAWGPRSQQALDSYRASSVQQQNTGLLNQNDIARLHMQVHGTSLVIATSGLVQAPKTGGGFSDLNSGFGSASDIVNDAEVLEPSAYQHIARDTVDGSEGARRQIAIQMLKARPKILDIDENLLSWFNRENPHNSTTELRITYKNANQSNQEEIIRQFKADLLQEATDTAAVSEENPLRIAIYNPVPYGFGDYVDGRGLPFASGSASGASFRYEQAIPYFRPRLVVRTDTPGAEFVNLPREEASSMLNQIKDSKKTLYRVAWGRLTNIGADKSVASFATAGGVNSQVQVASTFIVDKLTLSVAGYAGSGVQAQVDPEAIYEYSLNASIEENISGQDVFAYLQASGMPTKNRHLLTFSAQSDRRAINEVSPGRSNVDVKSVKSLLYRVWLRKNPDYVHEGRNFILVAINILDESEMRQFFGDSAQSLSYIDGATNMNDITGYGFKLFPDEFAEAEAKEAFLANIYPRKMAEFSDWNVPVMNVIGATLLRYDTDGGYFPILYDDNNVVRPEPFYVAGFMVRGKYNQNVRIYSADRVTTLPDRLELPFDQAKELRKQMNGSDRVYLAWTANFQMGEDGLLADRALNPKAKFGDFEPSPGRASIEQVGLFMDPNLNTMLKEFDVASLEILPANSPTQSAAAPEAVEQSSVVTDDVKVSVNQVVATPEVEVVAMSDVTTSQNDVNASAPEQSVWPQAIQLTNVVPIRDMVGLRIGDPVSGVDQIIAKEFDLTQTFQTETPDGNNLSAFEYVRVFVIAGGKQVISVMSYGPDGPILGISRHLYRAGEPWPHEVIAKRLLDKYGEPTTKTFNDRTMVWASSDVCANFTLSPLGSRQFMSVGSGIPNGKLDEHLAAQALGGLAILAKSTEALINGNANCGEVLQYSNQSLAPVSGHYGFFTFMTNIGLVQKVLEATEPKQETVEIKF